MGGTRWSDRHYHDRAAELKRTNRSAFGHNEDIDYGRVQAGVHEDMDPSRFRNGVREARDSEVHPHSTPIAVMFDVTGSMRRVPRILQQNLCKLLGLCLRRGFVEDPAILIAGIGDATCDVAPVQIGQFESGNEIEQDLDHLYLEGGGGGQMTESYELALYFLARKAAVDCYAKRGKRGYAFIIGDEMPYPRVKRREVRRIFGDHLQADIPLRQILAEAEEKFEIYSVLPNLTSYYTDRKVIECWRDLLGQRALRLDDPKGISELIATTVGLAENAVATNDVGKTLRGEGIDRKIAKAVSTALAGVGG